MSLKLMLEETAGRYGRKTAIVFGDRRLSYAELDEASNKVANTLIRMGVTKGDRVAMLLPNSPEFAITYFGIVKAGSIAVPLGTNYKVNELASLFDNCQPKVLVAESPTLEPLVPALPRFKSIKHIIDLGSKYEGQFLSYRDIMATSSAQRIEVEPGPEDIATISYTGGPTNRPRGVMLSHRSLVTEAIISGDGFQQTDKDIVMLFALPLLHLFGLTAVLLASVYKGSTVVIVPGTGLSISILMATIEKEKGTMFLGVPYIFALVVDIAEKEGVKNDLSSLRLCSSGGAPLSIDIIQRFKQHYGFDLIDIWGLTEATCHVTCPPIDGTRKLGSVGKALPGWEVKIVDDNGRELLLNQPGEIIVRGPIMKGYYNNPQATAEVIKDGWLYTGDIGRVDEDGYLFLSGRKKETIIVKGQNIYPSDIEDVLYTHPKVAEAAVVGIPDELRGEVVRAVISLKEGEVTTEEEIRRFCRKHMADYKVPKQVIFIDSLPKTATGKIRKEDLRG
ncbi:Long-chain-fatty-acid--CoA ligase [subsurface metagenome]